MCQKESIHYNCGHSSLPVIRPCPLTTQSPDFPICSLQAGSDHMAKTMCSACERVLQGRWVLVQAKENRWIHERGACACHPVRPGTSTALCIGGENDQLAMRLAVLSTNSAVASTTDDEARPLRPTAGGFVPRPDQTTQFALYDTRTHGAWVPNLYAASWLRAHRLIHQAGQCTCEVDVNPVDQHIHEDDLNEEEKAQHEAMGETAQLENGGQTGDVFTAQVATIPPLGEPSGAFAPVNSALVPTNYPYPLRVPNGNIIWLTAPSNATTPTSQTSGTSQTTQTSQTSTTCGEAETNQAETTQAATASPVVYRTPRIAPGTQHVTGHTPNSLPARSPERTPVLGLPLGAGPEGTYHGHMPPWRDCALSRPRRHSSGP